ncbi:unnamed protein product, partial [Ceratitis capitata]
CVKKSCAGFRLSTLKSARHSALMMLKSAFTLCTIRDFGVEKMFMCRNEYGKPGNLYKSLVLVREG